MRLAPRIAGLALLAGVSAASAASDYDHFLYLGRRVEGGTYVEDAIMLATVTPGKIQTRKLVGRENLAIALRFHAVVGGKVFIQHIGDLLAIDAATGQTQRLAEYFPQDTACRDGQLYYLNRRGQDSLNRIDMSLQAQTVVMDLPNLSMRNGLALSPDGKHAAFWSAPQLEPGRPLRMGANLHIADLEKKKLIVSQFVAYQPAMTSDKNFMSQGGPMVWIDDKTLITVGRLIDDPQGQPASTAPGGATLAFESFNNRLLTVSTDGKSRQVAPLPGSGGHVLLLPPTAGSLPTVIAAPPQATADSDIAYVRYALDLAKDKLVESPTRIGAFTLAGGDTGRGYYPWTASEIRLGDKVLAKTATPRPRAYGRPMAVAVSPDGQRLVYRTSPDGSTGEIQFVDATDGQPHLVTQGYDTEPFFFCRAADLVPPAAPSATMPATLPAGYVALHAEPWPPPPVVDTRPAISEALSLTLATDKPLYKVHEPVEVTLTLTNLTRQDQSVQPPSLERQAVQAGLLGPRVHRTLERGWMSDPAKVVKLAPGKSLSGKVILEPSEGPGPYTIEAEYVGWATPNGYRGHARATPATFRVEKTANAADDQALQAKKLERLIARMRQEYQQHKDRPEGSSIDDDIRGLGPAVTPLLLEAIASEKDPQFRRWLRYPTQGIATPEAVKTYARWLTSADEDEQHAGLMCLRSLLADQATQEAALPPLIAALQGKDLKLARQVADTLKHWDSDEIEAAFETALDSPDPTVAHIAARYLAAIDGKPLAKWLHTAADKPDKGRYLAARTIVPELETTWQLKKGPVPAEGWDAVSKNADKLAQFKATLRAWATWAQENPQSSGSFFDADKPRPAHPKAQR